MFLARHFILVKCINRKAMKTIITILIIAFAAVTVSAQNYVTINASKYDISDNLDLKAVAYLFGESKSIEVFERKLNDPELNISNLDLNYDGYIDYLRVVEIGKNNYYVITIQAVLGENIYQDVATIDVEVKNRRTLKVQVVGNPYLYGRNYVIKPVYAYRPVIIDFYVKPRRYLWSSPWYWGYYPTGYFYRQPREVHAYHHYIYNYYGTGFKCQFIHYQPHHKSAFYHKKLYRNDWAKIYPDKSFENRNKDVRNSYELNNRRSAGLDQQFPVNNSKSVYNNKNMNTNPNNNRREVVTKSQPIYKAPADKSSTNSSSSKKYEQNNNSRRNIIDNNASSRSQTNAINNSQYNSSSTTNVHRNDKSNSNVKSASVKKQNESRREAEVSHAVERSKKSQTHIQQKSEQKKPDIRQSSSPVGFTSSSKSENSLQGGRR